MDIRARFMLDDSEVTINQVPRRPPPPPPPPTTQTTTVSVNAAAPPQMATISPIVREEEEILEVELIGNGDKNVSLNDFSEFLDTGQFSDLVLRCADGRHVECHRLLFAARATNFKHFVESRNFKVTEIVFRRCVKYEHLQALVSLVYRCHITGAEHEITSTLWKLIKIFGVRVSAQCFAKNVHNGHKELAHELKYDGVESAAKGALKFERIVGEFRSEARRKVRRRPNKRKPVRMARDPSVIVISDEEHVGGWSSVSCSSSLSSLSSSSSDLSFKNGGDCDEESKRPRATKPIVQNGGALTHTSNNHVQSRAAKISMKNSNSALNNRNGIPGEPICSEEKLPLIKCYYDLVA